MSEVSVNPRTGLREEWDPFFQVPRVQQRSLGALRFEGQLTAVHAVPLGRGLTLDWYARLGRGDELFVTFQGAASREKNIYPMFTRVSSMRGKAKAFMSFADPTLLVDHSREMLLSWHLGGPGWDPIPAVLRVIRRAQRKTGARHIAFLGGSGGGYAALRASAAVPGSMAFVQEPQTTIAKYLPPVVARYFDTVWGDWDAQKLMEAFPERFDMVRHYAAARPENFVYYVQSRADSPHVENHYAPFRELHGVTTDSGVSRGGNRHFVLYDGEVPGHGKITAGEFDRFFQQAVAAWRASRGK
ncbi:hypothetical protein [Brachybacterium phenoliresistens]|uniref:hypothetical protein n=1 Tax=Brachybacterium phenoliresistens TaxID=396014 RepID=UPI0031E16716